MEGSVFILILAVSIYSRTKDIGYPSVVVFDETVYDQYVLLLSRHQFFFDSQPPLGKLILFHIANLTASLGNTTGDVGPIGSAFPVGFPFVFLRICVSLCGALLPVVVYKILLSAGCNWLAATLTSVLVICETGLLVNCRFVSIEPIQLLFTCITVLFAVLYYNSLGERSSALYLCFTSFFLSLAVCTKYSCLYTMLLIVGNFFYDTWQLLDNPTVSLLKILRRFLYESFATLVVPTLIYLLVWHSFLSLVNQWGPQSHLMSVMFQTTFENGHVGQPVAVEWGSQLTLRSDSFTPCWLQSSDQLYPVRYADGRGSSHQAAVYCADRKTTNNWWILQRPTNYFSQDNLIRNGDIFQLQHGMTGRLLNSHDVAGPESLGCQEVSGYVDHKFGMEPETLWRLEIVNVDSTQLWYQLLLTVQLVHLNSEFLLKLSGRKLPDWANGQLEVIADRNVEDNTAHWTVEEMKQKSDQSNTHNAVEYSFWHKLMELHSKILWPTYAKYTKDADDFEHLYQSEPYEWLLGDSTIVYWQNHSDSTERIELTPSRIIYSMATAVQVLFIVIFTTFVVRHCRGFQDLSHDQIRLGIVAFRYFFLGHLLNFIPYWFYSQPLFIHDYFTALLFQLLLTGVCCDLFCAKLMSFIGYR